MHREQQLQLDHRQWSATAWYTVSISILIIVMSLSGYALIRQQKQFLIHEKQKEISTIADLKVAQLVQWRKERFAEGVSIRSNALLSRRIHDHLSSGKSGPIQQEFNHWISSLIDLGEYSKGVLFSPDGRIIARSPENGAPVSGHYSELVAEASREHELILSDLHSDGVGDPFDLNLVVPIMDAESGNQRCIAVLVFDIDPGKRLYRLIQSWPSSSESAETLLVRREGDSVHFLNELRDRKKTETPFELPLTQKELPAARAALGQEGSFSGIDYRGTSVLSAIRTVPGTQWGLVAKIDMSEVLSPLAKTVVIVSAIGVILSASLILGASLFGARRRTEALQKLVELEQKHIDDLKKSEESLTKSRDYHLKLLEMFPSLIWRSGINGQCDYFNQTWLTFTGRSLEQELGSGWQEGVHPEDLERCKDTFSQSLVTMQQFEMEYRLRHHDGDYRWINDHGRPYFDLNDRFAGFIGSCFDINDQKIAEAKLYKIHSQLEQQISERTSDLSDINTLLRQEITEREQLEQKLLNAKRLEAIGQIAGGVAHEVRNPLNAILTITEALFKEHEIASNPEFEPFIQHIRTQVTRLVHLMNDLLDLGRTIPESNLLPVPLYDLCRETVDLWKSSGLSKYKRAVLTSDHDDISYIVKADAIKLQQVFFNLLENAGFHSTGSDCITIQLTRSSPDLHDTMALIQIIDKGSGIPENKLPHIFEPFYTDRKGGTGLGLALVKHFLENMGGSVQIRNNEPPPGCTVEVRVPLYRQEN